MWNSWAIYVCIALVFLLAFTVMWGYRRDKRDQINYTLIRSDKKKLYIGVYLDPIVIARKN